MNDVFFTKRKKSKKKMHFPATIFNKNFCSVLQTAFDNEEDNPDFIIRFTGSEKFVRLHQFVLKNSSPVLKALVRNGMHETIVKEAEFEEDPISMTALLQFLYTGAIHVNDIENAMDLWSLANKYEIRAAETILEEQMEKSMTMKFAKQIITQADAHEGLLRAANTHLETIPTIYLQGSSYQGDTKDKLIPHGYGEMTYVSGVVYTGCFSNGVKQDNNAVQITPLVGTYEGRFRDNFPCGKGKYTWFDGAIFEGKYKNGVRHGTAKIGDFGLSKFVSARNNTMVCVDDL
jgi:hypothetical protein